MNDLVVLRAVVRLSRMRRELDGEALALRAGGSVEEVRAALGRLSRAALVERSAAGVRPTMAGLAVAVAFPPGTGASLTVAQAEPRPGGRAARSKRRAA